MFLLYFFLIASLIKSMFLLPFFEKGVLLSFFKKALQPPRKPDQISADTKPGTRSCAHRHTRQVGIQNAKGSGSSNRQQTDFIEFERVFRDCPRGNRDHNTFNKVFNDTFNQFRKIKTAEIGHLSIFILLY